MAVESDMEMLQVMQPMSLCKCLASNIISVQHVQFSPHMHAMQEQNCVGQHITHWKFNAKYNAAKEAGQGCQELVQDDASRLQYTTLPGFLNRT